MSKHDISDKLAIRLLPKVTVLVASKNEDVIKSAKEQEYPINLILSDSNESDATFYNRNIHNLRDKTDIFFFLNNYQWFSQTDSITKIVEEFVENDMTYAAIYTDTIRVTNDGMCFNEFLPAFDPAIFQAGIIINNTIAVQSKHLPPKLFNEKLNHLYFFYALQVIGSRFILEHLAEPLFKIVRHDFNLQEEFQNFQ